MLLTTLTTAPFLIKGSSSPACSKKYMRKCQVTYWLIDWIGFNGHSTAMVILGRPREREGYIGNPLSNFYGSLTCREERLWYTGPPGKRPHPTDVAREKCLAKGHSQYTTVAPPPRLEPGTSVFTVQCAIHYATRPSSVTYWRTMVLLSLNYSDDGKLGKSLIIYNIILKMTLNSIHQGPTFSVMNIPNAYDVGNLELIQLSCF